MANKKKFKRSTFAEFKKMTLDVVTGKIKADKKVKNWVAGYSSDGIMGALRSTFIHTPQTPRAARQMHEWAKINRLQRENHPVASFLLTDIPRYLRVKQMRLNDAVWWVKYRTMKEHNHHTVHTGLKPGYHDSDKILLHSTMAVLVDYVENSGHGGCPIGEEGLAKYVELCEADLNPKNWQDWERKLSKKRRDQRIALDTKNVNGCKEVLAVYRWWKYQRDAEHLVIEKQRDINFAARDYHFMDDERDPHAFTGVEKKKYDADMKASTKLWEAEDALRQKDTNMMVRLTKARNFMW